jgi:hypothetical protein
MQLCFSAAVRKERNSVKNPYGKTVQPEQAYSIHQDEAGEWTFFVLKHYQLEENAAKNPYSRYFCLVKSPICPNWELGDVYRNTMQRAAIEPRPPFRSSASSTSSVGVAIQERMSSEASRIERYGSPGIKYLAQQTKMA